MRSRSLLLAPAVLAAAALTFAPAATGTVRLVPLGMFEQPVHVSAPPGDTHRVFVVERTGTIRVVVDGTRQTEPYLDIRSLVSQPTGPADERGLMSVAFAPDYSTSGRLYVYHTTRKRRDPAASNVVLDEYRAIPPSASTVDPSTRRRVIAIPAGTIHFGGQIAFGPDGFLWVGPGDGRGPGDPLRNGQNRWRLQGKLLRIDPREGRSLSPRGNPYRGGGGSKLVWAYGLRNPYRFSFDRITGDLAIGDVGQNFIEEINFVSRRHGLGRGANFGWSTLEGKYRYRRATPAALRPARPRERPARAVRPAIEHLHSRGWCAIVGGHVVRDPELPSLYGSYVYGDFCKGTVMTSTLRHGRRATGRATRFAVQLLSSFGEDGCGRIYVTSLRGPVLRLAESGRCAGPAPVPFPTPRVATNAPSPAAGSGFPFDGRLGTLVPAFGPLAPPWGRDGDHAAIRPSNAPASTRAR